MQPSKLHIFEVSDAKPCNFTALYKETAKTSPPASDFVPNTSNHHTPLPHTSTGLNINVHSLIVHCQSKAQLLSLGEDMCLNAQGPFHSSNYHEKGGEPSIINHIYIQEERWQKIKHGHLSSGTSIRGVQLQ